MLKAVVLQAHIPGFQTFFRGIGLNKALVHFLTDFVSRPDAEMLRHLAALRLHFAARLVAREWADAACEARAINPIEWRQMGIDTDEHTDVIQKAQEYSPIPIDAIFPQQPLRDQRYSATTVVKSPERDTDKRNGRGSSPVVTPLPPTPSSASENEHGSGSTACPTPALQPAAVVRIQAHLINR